MDRYNKQIKNYLAFMLMMFTMLSGGSVTGITKEPELMEKIQTYAARYASRINKVYLYNGSRLLSKAIKSNAQKEKIYSFEDSRTKHYSIVMLILSLSFIVVFFTNSTMKKNNLWLKEVF